MHIPRSVDLSAHSRNVLSIENYAGTRNCQHGFHLAIVDVLIRVHEHNHSPGIVLQFEFDLGANNSIFPHERPNSCRWCHTIRKAKAECQCTKKAGYSLSDIIWNLAEHAGRGQARNWWGQILSSWPKDIGMEVLCARRPVR